MKNTLLVIIAISFIFGFSNSETAYTLEKGKFEVGLFQPLKYGYSEKIEFSTHPIFDFLIPNGSVKIYHTNIGKFEMASRHSFNYPTFLLRTLTLEGSGGFVAPDPDIPEIPQMFSLKNELLLTTQINSFIVTGKMGMNFAIGDEPDIRTLIELPIVYPRLAVFYNQYSINSGGDVRYSYSKNLDILIDADVILLPESDEDKQFFFEHKAMIEWQKSNRFQIVGGYKFVYGEYPFGSQWKVLPVIDFKWRL